MFGDAQNQGAFLAGHQIIDRGIVCGQDAPGMHQQPGAPVGEHHAASIAPNHRLPDRRLELAYMLTDRGLGQVQHSGGAVESPQSATAASDRSGAISNVELAISTR